MIKKQVEKLEEPCLQCIDAVFEELQRIVLECELPEMQRFINLRESIFEVVRGVLKKCLQPTNQMILNIIQVGFSRSRGPRGPLPGDSLEVIIQAGGCGRSFSGGICRQQVLSRC